MIDQSYIGTTWPCHSVELEKGRLQFYAKAIGETDPVYFDEPAAKSAGYDSLPLPPTLLFGLDLVSEPGLRIAEMGVDLTRVLHAEQSFEYFKLAFAGDRLTFTTRVADVYQKNNGALEFVSLDTDVVDQRDEKVATMRCLMVVRGE